MTCHLETLTLNYCSVRDLGACYLAQALKTNTSLKEVSMYDASIGTVGHIALAEAALQNTTLKVLCLSKN